jgi:peroxiredoxin
VQLLSDWNGEATRGFGVGTTVRGMSEISRRSAFLIEDLGTVRAAWAYEGGELPDFDPILAAARAR